MTDSARTHIVGYQGAEGSFSHMAAQRHFAERGTSADLQGMRSFREMLRAVHDGRIDYAVLPIENTTAGSINEAYDLLAKMNLALVGEIVQRVVHCLIGLAEDVAPSELRRVISHPQALAQCSEFLESLTDCRLEAYTDTALAVAKVAEDGERTQGAIASEEAARRHGLPVLAQDIANQRLNFTRMVVVAVEPEAPPPQTPAKTSLMLTTRHEEGALARCLLALADRGMNLTKLESRPLPNTPWQYLFYLDFEGHVDDPDVRDALECVRGHCESLRVLGCYPRSDTRPHEGA